MIRLMFRVLVHSGSESFNYCVVMVTHAQAYTMIPVAEWNQDRQVRKAILSQIPYRASPSLYKLIVTLLVFVGVQNSCM